MQTVCSGSPGHRGRLHIAIALLGLRCGVVGALGLTVPVGLSGVGRARIAVLDGMLIGSAVVMVIEHTLVVGRVPPSCRTAVIRLREALEMISHGPHRRRTLAVALIVGTVLTAINHLGEMISGRVEAGLIMRIGLTYLVPFCVSNYGLLAARPRTGTAALRPRSRR